MEYSNFVSVLTHPLLEVDLVIGMCCHGVICYLCIPLDLLVLLISRISLYSM